MLAGILLVLSGSFDAQACINGMDKEKKSTSGTVIAKKPSQDGLTPPKDRHKPSKAQGASHDNTTKGTKINEKSEPEVVKPQPPAEPKSQSPAETKPKPESKAPSSCSSLGLMSSLWGLLAMLPFLVRRSE